MSRTAKVSDYTKELSLTKPIALGPLPNRFLVPFFCQTTTMQRAWQRPLKAQYSKPLTNWRMSCAMMTRRAPPQKSWHGFNPGSGGQSLALNAAFHKCTRYYLSAGRVRFQRMKCTAPLRMCFSSGLSSGLGEEE
jgi:hypothetical protein